MTTLALRNLSLRIGWRTRAARALQATIQIALHGRDEETRAEARGRIEQQERRSR